MTEVGERYVEALAAKDTAALLDVLAPDVAFRGMTPGRFWEAGSAEAVVHEVLYRWFDAADVVEGIDRVESSEVADRHRVDYRLRVRNDGGLHLVQQHAYFDVDDTGRISLMQAMCAGFRPVDETSG